MTFNIEQQRQLTLRKRKLQQILVGFENSFRTFECEPIIKPLTYGEAEEKILALFELFAAYLIVEKSLAATSSAPLTGNPSVGFPRRVSVRF